MGKLIVVIGTRPELIKTAPVIREFAKREQRGRLIVVNTAQHQELMEPFWEIFDVHYDFKLDFMHTGQSLGELSARATLQFEEFIHGLEDRPLGILAQGDTTTVMVASMVAFYNHIPFFHLEAGLRSFDLQHPFPEEFNRKVTSIIASYHFAPTEFAKQCLLKEGISIDQIRVTGNTVVDALQYIISTDRYRTLAQTGPLLMKTKDFSSTVLITCHRRENFGKNLESIIRAVKTLADEFADICFIWPLHPNPNVQEVLLNSILTGNSNVILVPPVDYVELLSIIAASSLVITDSGGIQEEAPSFNTPVLVLREKTERPEGIELGIGILVGADEDKIVHNFQNILNCKPAIDANPYGDGRAAGRIVDNLSEHF